MPQPLTSSIFSLALYQPFKNKGFKFQLEQRNSQAIRMVADDLDKNKANCVFFTVLGVSLACVLIFTLPEPPRRCATTRSRRSHGNNCRTADFNIPIYDNSGDVNKGTLKGKEPSHASSEEKFPLRPLRVTTPTINTTLKLISVKKNVDGPDPLEESTENKNKKLGQPGEVRNIKTDHSSKQGHRVAINPPPSQVTLHSTPSDDRGNSDPPKKDNNGENKSDDDNDDLKKTINGVTIQRGSSHEKKPSKFLKMLKTLFLSDEKDKKETVLTKEYLVNIFRFPSKSGDCIPKIGNGVVNELALKKSEGPNFDIKKSKKAFKARLSKPYSKKG